MAGRPDILLVMTDQQRWDSLGHAGNGFVATPHLDRFAAGALRFRNAVTPFPLCSPARAGLWTGLAAHRHGVTDNIYGEPDALARLGVPSIFPAIQAAGYRTGYIGKWHLGEGRPAGFDHWAGYNSAESHWLEGRTWRPHRETEAAIDLLRAWSDGPPILLVVSYYPPHPPYDAPDEQIARYRGRGIPHPLYYAAVEGIDACVGRLLGAVDGRPAGRERAIFYFSDHGETFQVGKGSKRTTQEEALRIPLLVRAPGAGPAGIEAPASLLDVAPTLARLAGMGCTGASFAGDGVDLLDLAAGRIERSAVVVENVAIEPVATRDGNLRQLVGVQRRAERTVWTGRRKLTLRDVAKPQLFDLTRDPEERFNLFGRLREGPIAAMAGELLVELEAATARTGDAEGRALASAFRRILG